MIGMQCVMHRQVGAMRICLGAGMVCYAGQVGGTEEDARYALCDYVQETGDYAQKTEGKSGSNDSKGILGRKCLILMKNGLIKPIFGGMLDMIYNGFRKCFVNCKFTFYITLS